MTTTSARSTGRSADRSMGQVNAHIGAREAN